MLRIAIDGACRRNGQPDCVSAGGLIAIDEYSGRYETLHRSERASTNQRGELLALKAALMLVLGNETDAQIITDSEYLFNTMTKGWLDRWQANGWRTAAGDAVKNEDLLRGIASIFAQLENEVTFYHIKGHVVPFGKVTASRLYETDKSAKLLFNSVLQQVDQLLPTKPVVVAAAQELSVKNNGFELPDEIFRTFVAMNVVADAVATYAVEAADLLPPVRL